MPTRMLHLMVGIAVIAVFLLTGYYMRFHIYYLMEANERLRFSLRGNHIYILLLGVLNLSLGAYLRVSKIAWRAYVQLVGSLMILSATGLVMVAFFFENKELLERPFTLLTVILALVGAMLHVVSNIRTKE